MPQINIGFVFFFLTVFVFFIIFFLFLNVTSSDL